MEVTLFVKFSPSLTTMLAISMQRLEKNLFRDKVLVETKRSTEQRMRILLSIYLRATTNRIWTR